MDVLITPKRLGGCVAAIPSKSVAHRMLILAALGSASVDVRCGANSQDIEATKRCLHALGASLARTRDARRMMVIPVGMRGVRGEAQLDCGESGSTLRFLLPIVAALGSGATFVGSGRLVERPLAPLDEELRAHGVRIDYPSDKTLPLRMSGRLSGGRFRLPGDVSSQFVSGLLMAAPLLHEPMEILVRKPVQSEAYVQLTIDALAAYGVQVSCDTLTQGTESYMCYTPSLGPLKPPRAIDIEGDWSNAAFWLAAGALATAEVSVSGLDLKSHQGDRTIMGALALMGARIGRAGTRASALRDRLEAHSFDVSGIPDLVPPLAAVCAYAKGSSRLTNAARLRLKESDRLLSTAAAINAMGGSAKVVGDDLVIEGREALTGGVVDAHNDHRIAMMASICAAYATGPTTICDAGCVAKSYPSFFDDFRALGGLVRSI